MKKQTEQFASIQFLRAIAAVFVVLLHNFFFYASYVKLVGGPDTAMEHWHYFRTFGAVGVQIFFVISGFIMGHLHARNPDQTASSFIGQRLTRIVPLYWICSAYYVLTAPHVDVAYALQSFFFLPVKGLYPLVGVGWTLNYEMFFYLAFCVVVIILQRSILWIAAIFGIFQILTLFTTNYAIQFYGDSVVWTFFAGVVIHRIYRERLVLRLAPLIFIAGIAGLIRAVLFFNPVHNYGLSATIHWGIPSALLVLGCLACEHRGMLHRLFRCKLFQLIGASSYSLYLIHGYLFIYFNFTLLADSNLVSFIGPDLSVLVLVACACVAGYACYRLVELPTMRVLRAGHRWARGARAGDQAAP